MLLKGTSEICHFRVISDIDQDLTLIDINFTDRANVRNVTATIIKIVTEFITKAV